MMDGHNLFSFERPATKVPLVNEIVMAIDYGQKGGFAWNDKGVLDTLEMPSNKQYIINLLAFWKPAILVGEDVHAMPGQGVTSIATFMRDAGFIDGACAALGIKQVNIPPQVWTKWYEFGKREDFGGVTGWKKHLLANARRLFPNTRITKECADAVLIWNYWTNPERIKKPTQPKFK